MRMSIENAHWGGCVMGLPSTSESVSDRVLRPIHNSPSDTARASLEDSKRVSSTVIRRGPYAREALRVRRYAGNSLVILVVLSSLADVQPANLTPADISFGNYPASESGS